MFDFNLKRQIEMQHQEGNFDWFERQKYSSRSNLISNNQCKWLPSLSEDTYQLSAVHKNEIHSQEIIYSFQMFSILTYYSTKLIL